MENKSYGNNSFASAMKFIVGGVIILILLLAAFGAGLGVGVGQGRAMAAPAVSQASAPVERAEAPAAQAPAAQLPPADAGEQQQAAPVQEPAGTPTPAEQAALPASPTTKPAGAPGADSRRHAQPNDRSALAHAAGQVEAARRSADRPGPD